MAKSDEYASELLRLKKDQLVDIIIKKKVSDDINSSERLKNYVLSGFGERFPILSENSTEHSKENVDTRISFMESKLEIAAVEIRYLKRAVVRLEKVIADKKLKINLLNKSNNGDNNNSSTQAHDISKSNVAHVIKISSVQGKDNTPKTPMIIEEKTTSEKLPSESAAPSVSFKQALISDGDSTISLREKSSGKREEWIKFQRMV